MKQGVSSARARPPVGAAFRAAYAALGVAGLALWSFFFFDYARPLIAGLVAAPWRVPLYLAVSLCIAAGAFGRWNSVWGLVGALAPTAAAVWATLVFGARPYAVLLALGACAACFIAVAAVFFARGGTSAGSRLRSSLAAGKRAASLALAAIILCAAFSGGVCAAIRARPKTCVPPSDAVSQAELETCLGELEGETWSELPVSRRLDTLQTACNYMCAQLGVEPLAVRLGAFEGGLSEARYYRKGGAVAVSVYAVERQLPKSSLAALARGVYNAYQANCAELYRSSPDALPDGQLKNDAQRWSRALGGGAYWKYLRAPVADDAGLYAQTARAALAEYAAPRPETAHNPLDLFFAEYAPDAAGATSAVMTAYAEAKRDLWLAELNNAYRILGECINAKLPSEARTQYADMLDGALAGLLAYAPNAAYTQALCEFTNALCADGGEEEFYAGSGLGRRNAELLADIYRAEALRAYSLAGHIRGASDTAEFFVFDSAAFTEAFAAQNGVSLARGSD